MTTPRTKHINSDGSPIFSNRLTKESSPYLLQHAHNPVDWYPWGDEAFQNSKKFKKPIFLSIGYSTCHWCHVMEEESFEDEEIARYINKNYIAIKVDREERPDIDLIYMEAVQSMTGSGGWPMSVWLTHDAKPFFGGTYFPAREGDRGSHTGFLTLLEQLNEVYHSNPEKIKEYSDKLVSYMSSSLTKHATNKNLPTAATLDKAFSNSASRFDAVHGGVLGAPKFPSSLPVRFFLRYHHQTQNEPALKMATFTLQKMAAGGLYDHVAGGFHRYSTDKKWLMPHFEKMLYDNALLTISYLEGYQAIGDQSFLRIVKEVLHYIDRDMTSPEGGFYSATDADSLTIEGEREEGFFFSWTIDEIDSLFDTKTAHLIRACFLT